MASRRLSNAPGIFIASPLANLSPAEDKENTEPCGTPTAKHGDVNSSRSALKSTHSRRRSSVGRRLSGFGSAGLESADQSKLQSMYSSIIKLSSENKITRERCWGLHFIDFMDKMILGDSADRGSAKVNFQKASCTLDASVKIYSHRVDATHLSSYSLLENLSRTDHTKSPADNEPATVGSSERSSRLRVEQTLRKAEQLNLSNMDRAYEVDPLFHKMSKVFDEAGSKGMLLNNLNVSDGCQLSFDSDVTAATAANPSQAPVWGATNDHGSEGVIDQGCEGREESRAGDQSLSPGRKEQVDDGQSHHGSVTDEIGLTDSENSNASPLSTSSGTLSAASAASKAPMEIESVPQGSTDGESSDPGSRRDKENHERSMAGETEAHGCGGMVDVSALRSKLFDICPDISTLGLFPQLLELREEIAELEGLGIGRPSLVHARRSQSLGVLGAGGPGSCDDSDDDGHHEGGFDYVPGADDASVGCLAGVSGEGADSIEAVGDERDVFQADMGESWAHPRVSIGGDAGEEAPGAMVPSSIGLEERLCADLKVVNDDYSYFEAAALASVAACNHWAGAAHWKFLRRNKNTRKLPGAAGQDAGTLEGDQGDGGGGDGDGVGGRKGRGKRKPPAIDFDAPAIPASAFAPPKAPSGRSRGGRKPAQDPTLLSLDYLNRAMKAAKDGSANYTLPENAGFTAKDLGELFLRPGAFAKRWVAVEGVLSGRGSGTRSDDLQGFHDSGNPFGGSGASGSSEMVFEDGGFDDGDDDDAGSEGFHSVSQFVEEGNLGGGFPSAGGVVDANGFFKDDFKMEGLVSADRQVEKIDITYAKKAKKVDVRRIKSDLWEKIDSFQKDQQVDLTDQRESFGAAEVDEAPLEGLEGERNEEGSAKRVSSGTDVVDLTFSDIVYDTASKEEQAGVTVPFYFICVLHLANEKGLRLEGRPDMTDFSVARDDSSAARP